jgi:hypothetical protein
MRVNNWACCFESLLNIDFFVASLSKAFFWYLVIAIIPCMNLAWRLSDELPRLPLLRLRRFFLLRDDCELESDPELGLLLGLRLGSDLERCPPLIRALDLPLPLRFLGLGSLLLLLLLLLMDLLLRSSSLSDLFLSRLVFDLPRVRLESESDLRGLGRSLLPDLLLDSERLLGLFPLELDLDLDLDRDPDLDRDWDLLASRFRFLPLPSTGPESVSLPMTSRQAVSNSSVSGGSPMSTEEE